MTHGSDGSGRRVDAQPADEITFRLARMEDAERTFQIVWEAEAHLNQRMGRSTTDTRPVDRGIRFRHFCTRYDGERFWVAETGGSMIAAAYATLRDDVWYLAALHVLPEFQSRKIGSELIRRTLAGTGPATALIVLTEAINPVSNGLYMRFGMFPQDSILSFEGPLAGSEGTDVRPVSSTFTTRPINLDRDLGTLTAFDLSTVGFARPTDHEFWTGVPGLDGVMLQAEGSIRGYAYVSDVGVIGPIAVAHPEDLEPALAAAADIAAERGAETLRLRANGSAREASAWAISRGLRLSGIGLMLSSRPVGRLDRYVTSGGDALY